MPERLLKLLVSMFFYGLYRSASSFFSLVGKPFSGCRVILTYHAVKAHQSDRFRKQMDALLKGGTPVPANASYQPCYHPCNIAITFDDGFHSVIQNALPILRERRIPATIFVTTGFLGRKPGWIYERNHENEDEVLLTEEQVRGLTDDLITIGSHSVTHPHLSQIERDKVLAELVESKRTLEGLIERPVYLFSFPYGSYNSECLELARQAGYELLFSNVPILRSSKNAQNLTGRVHVSLSDSMVEFWLKLRGAYGWLAVAVVLKRQMAGLIKNARTRIRGEA